MKKVKSIFNKTSLRSISFAIFSVTATSIVLSSFAVGQKSSPSAETLNAKTEIQSAQTKAKAVAPVAKYDFDGDAKSDISVYRDGEWHMNKSGSGYDAQSFGLATDTPVPADFDGDGRTDIAIFRPSSVEGEPDFYFMNSLTNTLSGVSWGDQGDIPVSGDFDNDGSADFAVCRIGTDVDFFVLSKASTVPVVRHFRFGIAGDIPVVADYNGDGKSDFAVFRPSDSTWYINYSAPDVVGERFVYHTFGLPNDVLVSGEFDGDEKADYAVFRESDATWYIEQSSTGQLRRQQWGLGTDEIVPADYDGDGITDIATYRDGQWFIWQSSTNSPNYANVFGNSTDLPLQSLSVR
jgi:hypothetical protein